MACRKMNEDVAYARNTESGCNYEVPEGTKAAVNLFIELEKHKLNQIDG